MKIACIGWGSLIWKPKKLKIQRHWFEDGPLVPVEFTRISNYNRVTLIIDNESKPVRTLWALMIASSLKEAIDSLRSREGVTKDGLIHFVRRSDFVSKPAFRSIKHWLNEKNLDYAIWTGLSYSNKTDNKRPSVEQILRHLNELNSGERELAEEYIRKAPRQIDTEYRRYIESALGWTPSD